MSAQATGFFHGTLGRIFWVSRPLLWINTIGPALLGIWLTGQLWGAHAGILLLWLTLPFNLLIYGINDITDREVDAISERKGDLEGTKLSSSEILTVASFIIGLNAPFFLYFWLAMPPAAFGAIILYATIFVAYSLPPFRFKARPLLDSLSNAAYALPVMIMPLAMDKDVPLLALVGLMTWSMAKHTFDSIQDIEDDRSCSLKTTAVVFGLKFATFWSAGWWIVSTLLIVQINAMIGIIVGSGALFLIASLLRTPSTTKAHELYRYSIAYPYIAGGIAGVSLALAVWKGVWL